MLFDIALLEKQILRWVAQFLVCHRSIYFLLCFVSEQALYSCNTLTLSGSFVLTCKRDDFLKHFLWWNSFGNVWTVCDRVSFFAVFLNGILKICGFVVSSLIHLRNLQICNLLKKHTKFADFWFGDRNTKRICGWCGMSPRVCGLSTCEL